MPPRAQEEDIKGSNLASLWKTYLQTASRRKIKKGSQVTWRGEITHQRCGSSPARSKKLSSDKGKNCTGKQWANSRSQILTTRSRRNQAIDSSTQRQMQTRLALKVTLLLKEQRHMGAIETFYQRQTAEAPSAFSLSVRTHPHFQTIESNWSNLFTF